MIAPDLTCYLTFAVVTVVILAGVVKEVRKANARRWEKSSSRALSIADIDNMPGLEFETYVARLLDSKGFETTVTKASGDFGVDIIASKAGTRYAIQVKRYTGPISRRAISDAVAGKMHYGCEVAMVITNGRFTNDAVLLARSTKCQLIDRPKLAEWIADYHGRAVIV